jgi:hypothetical protein
MTVLIIILWVWVSMDVQSITLAIARALCKIDQAYLAL